MRISDWSSDVCSSDLSRHVRERRAALVARDHERLDAAALDVRRAGPQAVEHHVDLPTHQVAQGRDRKSVVSGKSEAVRVDIGGRRVFKKKKSSTHKISV